MKFYMAAYKLAEKYNNKPGLSSSTGNLGNLYKVLGQYRKSIQFQLMSLKYDEELKNPIGVIMSYHNLGNTYTLMHNTDSAFYCFNQELILSQKENILQGIGKAYGGLAQVMRLKNENQKSLEYYLKGLEINRQLGNELEICNAVSNNNARRPL